MKVRFLQEWQGSSIGEVSEFVPFITDDLLKRGIVEPYTGDSKKDAEIEELKAEIAESKKENASLKGKLTKAFAAPPVDKQVKKGRTKNK